MTTLRAGYSATRLPDGRILVAGGCTQHSCEGITASTEIVDPATGATEPGPDMLQPRVNQNAVVLGDGRIIMIGGFAPGTTLATTEIFDPATGTFAPGPDLPGPRADPYVAALADGSILLAGGYDGDAATATSLILDAQATGFTATGSMTEPRSIIAGATLPDGTVLVVGGGAGGATGEVYASAEVYDPTTRTWSPTGDMSERRYKHAALALEDGRVLVLGGSDERDAAGLSRSAETYDAATGAFTRTVDMAQPRFKIGGSVVRLLDGRVLVDGGAHTAEVFDPATGEWSSVAGDADATPSVNTAVLAGDGSVIVLGGYDEAVRLTDQILRFVP